MNCPKCGTTMNGVKCQCGMDWSKDTFYSFVEPESKQIKEFEKYITLTVQSTQHVQCGNEKINCSLIKKEYEAKVNKRLVDAVSQTAVNDFEKLTDPVKKMEWLDRYFPHWRDIIKEEKKRIINKYSLDEDEFYRCINPKDEKQSKEWYKLADLVEEFEVCIGERITNAVTREKIKEFDAIKDPLKAGSWLEKNVPSYRAIVEEERKKMMDKFGISSIEDYRLLTSKKQDSEKTYYDISEEYFDNIYHAFILDTPDEAKFHEQIKKKSRKKWLKDNVPHYKQIEQEEKNKIIEKYNISSIIFDNFIPYAGKGGYGKYIVFCQKNPEMVILINIIIQYAALFFLGLMYYLNYCDSQVLIDCREISKFTSSAFLITYISLLVWNFTIPGGSSGITDIINYCEFFISLIGLLLINTGVLNSSSSILFFKVIILGCMMSPIFVRIYTLLEMRKRGRVSKVIKAIILILNIILFCSILAFESYLCIGSLKQDNEINVVDEIERDDTYIASEIDDVEFERPTYTLEEIKQGLLGNTITFNSIVDGDIGDERDFIGAKIQGGTEWFGEEIEVQDGEVYTVRLYVDNNNPKGHNAIAEDVRALILLDTFVSKSHIISGTIDCSNSMPKRFEDDVKFVSDDFFYMEYILGSAYYTNKYMGTIRVSDSIITSGVPLGYELFDGNIPGGNQYDGVLTIDVKVHKSVAAKLDVKARLKGVNEWDDVVDANKGDQIEIQVEFQNLKSDVINDVMIRDILPDHLEYIENSTYLYNEYYPDGTLLDGNGIALDGINIGSYGARGNAYVRFSCLVVGGEEEGDYQLVNWANCTINDVVYKDDVSVFVNYK